MGWIYGVYLVSDDDGGGDERLLRFYGRYGFEVVCEYGGCVVEMVRKVKK